MIDFTTLHGIDGYKAAFPGAFDGATEEQTKRVVTAIHNGVLEGYEPDWEAVRNVVLHEQNPSPVTDEEIVERARRRLERRAGRAVKSL